MKLSKSKINSYLKCPREFKYRYIDEIEVPPNEYMITGTNVHEIAEIYSKIYGNNPQENPKYFLELIAKELNIDIPSIDSHINGLASFFKETYIENNYKLFSQEEYLFDETHNFSGITDIILEDEKGDLVVIDYKTGSSSSFSKYRLEIGYYKMLVESNYPTKKVKNAGIFFTKDNKLRLLEFCEDKTKQKSMKKEEIEKGLDILYEVRKNINSSKFPKKEQFLCKYCTYKEICIKDKNE